MSMTVSVTAKVITTFFMSYIHFAQSLCSFNQRRTFKTTKLRQQGRRATRK